jgi:hypothetical protein
MKFMSCIVLQALVVLALGQTAPRSNSHGLPNQPGAMVRRLYQEVVLHHPVGIPHGANMKIFAPYMSKALLNKIDNFVACDADWLRKNSEPGLKAPFGVSESGLFSGAYERTEPRLFHIGRTELEKDGTFRVYVGLTYEDPPGHPYTWHVAVVVVREIDHFAVDDVIYLRDKDNEDEARLSERLSYQCDGRRWVEHGDQRDTPKNQQ